MCTNLGSDIRPPFAPFFLHVPVPPQNTNQNVLSKHINSSPYVSRVGLSKSLNNGYHIVKNTEIKNHHNSNHNGRLLASKSIFQQLFHHNIYKVQSKFHLPYKTECKSIYK